MNSQDEKNNDTISTSYSIILEKETLIKDSPSSIKINIKRKNKSKRLFKVKISNRNIKLSKLNIPKINSKKINNLFDFEIADFLQDKIEMKKMEGEIIQYENKIKNYTKEEKELFVTPKEIFINSVIDKYKLPLFVTCRNNQEKINQENKDNLYIIEK
jgi:hypothetical protein